jgi:hypothetical protein
MSQPSSRSPLLGGPADGCFSQCCLLGRNWLALAPASTRLLGAFSLRRPLEQIRYLHATGKIDFVKLYELLNDLLW